MALLNSNPETVYLGSDFKKIGDSAKVDISKINIVSQSVNQQKNNNTVIKVQEMSTDKIITPVEKKSLQSMLDSLTSSYNIQKADAEEQLLQASDEYINFLDMYQYLLNKMAPILADMNTSYYLQDEPIYNYYADSDGIGYGDGNVAYGWTTYKLVTIDGYFSLYYDASESLSSLISATKLGMTKEAYENSIVELDISVANPILRIGETTTISVAILRLGVDVTANYNASCFDWTALGSTDDTTFATTHIGMKSFTMSYADIADDDLTLTCRFTYDI